MANRYTWSDANSHNYKTGNYNGVAGNVTPLSRKTIADGNLLNSDIVEVFSSRDKYLLDSLNATDASARSVYKTVEDNSAANWPISSISGFSAINNVSFPSNAAAWRIYTDEPILSLTTAAGNTVVISGTNDMMSSYYSAAKTQHTDAYVNEHMLLGSNCTYDTSEYFNHSSPIFAFYTCRLNSLYGIYGMFSNANTGSIAMHSSDSNKYSICFSVSTGNSYGGINVERSKDNSHGAYCFNDCTNNNSCIAFNGSHHMGWHTVAINDCLPTTGALVLNGATATTGGIAIGRLSNTTSDNLNTIKSWQGSRATNWRSVALFGRCKSWRVI